ncbi:MAG: serpin family protein [Synergistaceae bacterium]
MRKLIILLLVMLITTTSYASTDNAKTINAKHWTYLSLQILVEEGLTEAEITPGVTVMTENEIQNTIKEAIASAQSNPQKLKEAGLISLRQLAKEYKEIIIANKEDYTKYRREIENCAIKAGLIAVETTQEKTKNEPLYKKATRSVNAFTFDIYKKISEENNNNLLISPYSISTALAMTYLGANGETESEFESVMKFTPTIHRNIASLINIINNTPKNEAEISTANAIWPATNFKILDGYNNSLVKYYKAKITTLNYKKFTSEATSKINKWVENKTNGKIKNIISQGTLSPNTKMVLTNTLYFKADWETEFKYKDTKVEDFWITADTSIKTSLMTQSFDKIKYAKLNDSTAIELEYNNDRYSMLVILPEESKTLSNLEKELSTEYFYDLESKLEYKKVKVTIPKFKREYDIELSSTLASMGMKNATSYNKANFTKMTKEKGIYIDKVIHKTFIEVGEKGTEAAAATAIIMVKTSLPRPETDQLIFKADKPFIYIIKDNKTNTILFIGKYVKP